MISLSDYSDSEDVLREYENEEIENENNNPNIAESEDKINVNVSQKRHVRAPKPTLNTERLKGPKGIHTIEKHFEGFKFYGKGHEKTDLARVMKRLEHWAHRLFPKLDFDDFLEKVEKLRRKKDLSVFINKYRQGMLIADNEVMQQVHDSSDEDSKEGAPIDEFDLLISEQITKQKQVNTQQNDQNDTFLSTNPCNSMQISQNTSTNILSVSLDDETRKRIERNRQQAIQRRLLKLKAMQNAEKKVMEKIEKVNIEDKIVPEEEKKVSNDDCNINSETS